MRRTKLNRTNSNEEISLITKTGLPDKCDAPSIPTMKINPRYYPAIIIAAYAIFLLLGILLGFGPERGGEGHENSMLFQLALATLESLT